METSALRMTCLLLVLFVKGITTIWRMSGRAVFSAVPLATVATGAVCPACSTSQSMLTCRLAQRRCEAKSATLGVPCPAVHASIPIPIPDRPSCPGHARHQVVAQMKLWHTSLQTAAAAGIRQKTLTLQTPGTWRRGSKQGCNLRPTSVGQPELAGEETAVGIPNEAKLHENTLTNTLCDCCEAHGCNPC